MLIIDHSPNHSRPEGKPANIAIYANTASQYYRARLYFETYYKATFPNGCRPNLDDARRLLPKNSKLILACFWNSITGKYELAVTNKKNIKANNYFWKYDFIGNLTDFALLEA